MRVLAAVLAVAASLSLSGCFWWSDAYDDSSSSGGYDGDAEFALVLLGIALLVGVVLVIVNLSNANARPPPPPPTPPQTTGPPQPAAPTGWEKIEETPSPPAKKRAAPKSTPKTPRRRAP